MVGWRQEADARLEAILAGFDHLLLSGETAKSLARRAIGEWMSWVLHSLQALGGHGLMSSVAPAEGGVDWLTDAEEAAEASELDPHALDRFLRLHLAMTHEMAARAMTMVHLFDETA